MADTKTSLETAAAALTGTELVTGVQSGGNVKMTAGNIAALTKPAGSGTEIQIRNGAAFAAAVGTSSAATGKLLTLAGAAATDTPLTLKGFTGVSVPILVGQTPSAEDVLLLYVTSSSSVGWVASSGNSTECYFRGYGWWFENPSAIRYAGFDGNKQSLSLGTISLINFSSTTDPRGTTDAGFSRGGAPNSVAYGTGGYGITMAGTATSRTAVNKAVASIANATATTVFTVTVPNAQHAATIQVELAGSLGAGGAIGAGEATGSCVYNVSVARTAGVNAVAAISAVYGSSSSVVAGASTITVAASLGAVAGAVAASNTFTVQVTVTRGTGLSANHTCLAYARLLNANATGITIS